MIRSARRAVLSTSLVFRRVAPPHDGAAGRTTLASQLPIIVRVCIAGAIVLGIFFRFYHLDRKVYWEDETYTSLHVLGETEAGIVEHAARYINANALRAVLHPPPPLRASVADTGRSLAVEDSQHPPLYYVAAHVWVKCFGDSVGTIRLLSAIFGVLALAAMYWLCSELFGSSPVAWIAVALFAIAPVAVLFSQEAREYILWSLSFICMSATFVRALRVRTATAWAFYALAAASSMYIFPVSAALAAANVAVAFAAGSPRGRATLDALAASVIALVAFAPWLAIEYGNRHQIAHAMGLLLPYHSTKIEVLGNVLALFNRNFFDFDRSGPLVLGAFERGAVLALIGYAFVRLIRGAPRRTWTFVVATTIAASAPFVLTDLAFGQHFTANPRYFMAFYFGITLALAYAFASHVGPLEPRGVSRQAWSLIFAAVIGVRLASCVASANADTWWSKFGERSIEVARVINESERPLLISSEFMERPLSLANYLDPGVGLQLRPACYLCEHGAVQRFDLAALAPPAARRDVFALGPSSAVQREIETVIRTSHSADAYRCIDDRLNEESACPRAALRLWPK